MTTDIDRRLALAIGYLPEHIFTWNDPETSIGKLRVLSRWTDAVNFTYWAEFSHTDPTVIWPIAAKYDCFPHKSACDGRWDTDYHYGYQDTPELAVAMAVIEAFERSKL